MAKSNFSDLGIFSKEEVPFLAEIPAEFLFQPTDFRAVLRPKPGSMDEHGIKGRGD